MKYFRSDQAVSPVVAVILMVAVTVILSAVIGTFALDLGQQATSDAGQSDIGLTTSQSNGTFTATIVTGTADRLTLIVNGTEVTNLSNVSAGDSLTANASSGDKVVIVAVSDGQRQVVSTQTIDETSTSTVSDPLFADDFEDGDFSEWTVVSGSSSDWDVTSTAPVANNTYSLKHTTTNHAELKHTNAINPSGNFSFVVNHTSSNKYTEVSFGYVNSSNYYSIFTDTSDGGTKVLVRKVSGGSITKSDSITASPPTNTDITVKVYGHADGDITVEWYWSGTLQHTATITDSEYTSETIILSSREEAETGPVMIDDIKELP